MSAITWTDAFGFWFASIPADSPPSVAIDAIRSESSFANDIFDEDVIDVEYVGPNHDGTRVIYREVPA